MNGREKYGTVILYFRTMSSENGHEFYILVLTAKKYIIGIITNDNNNIISRYG